MATLLSLPMMLCGCNGNNKGKQETPVVYFTKDISPEALVKLYEALGVEAQGKVAVKISTGESEKSNHLRPEFIAPLVHKVNGTIVECNTAYGGNRCNTEDHLKAIAERGYDKIAPVDIMDSEGEIKIPVKDDKWIKYDIVGSHIANYDFMIDLSHFKGHAMGGFGGALKNASIGVASRNGKAYIHTAGKAEDYQLLWQNLPEKWDESPEGNTPFIESMAAAAQAVNDYFAAKKGIVYINVLNNLSIDCDCDGDPHKPTIKDIGMAASLDPVALDKFCSIRYSTFRKTRTTTHRPSSTGSASVTASASCTVLRKWVSAPLNMSSRTLTDFNASPCRDDVETGGGEEVAEERDVVEAETQTGRAKMELGLVVWADQP